MLRAKVDGDLWASFIHCTEMRAKLEMLNLKDDADGTFEENREQIEQRSSHERIVVCWTKLDGC